MFDYFAGWPAVTDVRGSMQRRSQPHLFDGASLFASKTQVSHAATFKGIPKAAGRANRDWIGMLATRHAPVRKRRLLSSLALLQP